MYTFSYIYIIGSIGLSFGEGWVGIVQKAYPVAGEIQQSESQCDGKGIDFICTPFQVGQARVC